MEGWNVYRRKTLIGQHGEDGSYFPSVTVKVEEPDNEEGNIKNEPVFFPDVKKRKRLSLSQLKEVKAESCWTQSSGKTKTKRHDCRDRWSGER